MLADIVIEEKTGEPVDEATELGKKQAADLNKRKLKNVKKSLSADRNLTLRKAKSAAAIFTRKKESWSEQMKRDDAAFDKAVNNNLARNQYVIQLSELGFDPKAKPVGSGAEADIFIGDYCGLEVAIKVSKGKNGIDSDVENEIAILSKLRHPNIVLFLGQSKTETGETMLVEEFCGDGTLEDALFRAVIHGEKLSMRTRKRYIYELAMGMKYIHAQNLIHRDLKLANLLLSNGHLKIADFGLCKELPQGRNHKATDTFKMTGLTGSLLYMAPEVYLNKPYNQSADVYSFAMIMYYIYTGNRPFRHLGVDVDVQSVAKLASQGHRPTFPSKTKLFDKAVQGLMEKCWSAEPSQRPTSDTVLNQLREMGFNKAVKDKARCQIM